jgi:hypothetical protein
MKPLKFTNTLVLNVLYLKERGFKHREIAERLGIEQLQVQSCLAFAQWAKWKPPEKFIVSWNETKPIDYNPPLRLILINLRIIQQQLIKILEPEL